MKKILVVDDDPDVRKLLVLSLHKAYEVHEAPDIQSGIKAFNREHPALVFLDIRLPDGSGMDHIHDFTQYPDPATVIMLTSEQDISLALEAIDKGASEFITKPCSADSLRRIAARIDGEPGERPDSGVPWRKDR